MTRLTEVLKIVGNAMPADCAAAAGMTLHVANTRALREEAWGLVHRMYRARGMEKSNSAKMRILPADAHPEATTFLVRHDGRCVATLTLVPDSPLGLPSGEVCAAAFEKLRREGRVFCEMTKLAVDVDDLPGGARAGIPALLDLFRLAYLTARWILGATDIVASARPHHARFYENTLLFAPIGGPAAYDSVEGTPGVPMRLDLTTAQARYFARYANRSGSRNLHDAFVREDDARTVAWIAEGRRPLVAEDFRYFFVEKTNLLADADPVARQYLRKFYPDTPDRVFPGRANRGAGHPRSPVMAETIRGREAEHHTEGVTMDALAGLVKALEVRTSLLEGLLGAAPAPETQRVVREAKSPAEARREELIHA
ncbi:MAG: hypothetical protein V1809_06015 [Planctomycetota bacterium]